MVNYAHTHEKGIEYYEPLEVHLEAVEIMSKQFASAFGAGHLGELIGRWHDLGKYALQFQNYLIDAGKDYLQLHDEDERDSRVAQPKRVQHSIAGAKFALDMIAFKPLAYIFAYCISGHHAGLADWDNEGEGSLYKRLAEDRKDTCDALAKIPTSYKEFKQPAITHGLYDVSDSKQLGFQLSFLTRMLFSSLVDADFLATEQFMNSVRSEQRLSKTVSSMQSLYDQLMKQLDDIKKNADSTDVNQIRNEILDACQDAALNDPGFYTLTVPTGGGKTLSSMAFALRHAVQNNQRRVIYAIPFTSIIEQTAQNFRNIFTCFEKESDSSIVLEHHCNVDPKTETLHSQLSTENWDAPIIVTTNVQFFESLMHHKTSRCRKLHRIANSVIVLDEAQMLPIRFMQPCLAILKELVQNYGCTIVFCTATQPAIEYAKSDFPIGIKKIIPIIENPGKLHEKLKRVNVSYIGDVNDDTLVLKLAACRQSLCIVNKKLHASQLYQALVRQSECSEDSIYHLSTRLCPQHRSEMVAEIRAKLKQNQACNVISTQLIEAGVDLDFPVVYRAAAGLDSITQAAGRCNREGKLDHGQVYIFNTQHVLRELAFNRDIFFEILDDHKHDLLSPDAIENYFEMLYFRSKNLWDEKGIMSCFERCKTESDDILVCDFRKASRRFQFIENNTISVIVPFNEEANDLIDCLPRNQQGNLFLPPDRGFRRSIQRYIVQIYPYEFDKLTVCLETIVENELYLLNDTQRYHSRLGLLLELSSESMADSLLVI